jgi:hypothetical protein
MILEGLKSAATQISRPSFDHLVGATKQRERKGKRQELSILKDRRHAVAKRQCADRFAAVAEERVVALRS